MSYPCSICDKSFSTSSNRARHVRTFHGLSRDGDSFIVNGLNVLQHPFTCIVAGCTQSGKTFWVKSLLENAQDTITPPPQRIIWCYGQWQPSYLEMLKTIPGIEFNKGVPDDIDDPDYLDVSTRNLIVLDDLMSQSSKDSRIADLFTRGSHHRNLSVIYLVQNIFHQGKEMRNISLNAHYIVLFKSPRDKQQVSTLARQVSPGKVQEFMRSYEEATSRPHGYLLLDLKPTTDDGQRLKTNILPGEDSPMTDIAKYVKKQSYRQPPVLDAIYNTEQQINDIMQTSQLPSSVKSKLYSSQLNRLLTLKNKLQSPMVIDQSVAQPEEEIPQFIPETPKPYFLTPPPTEERAQLKRSFFHNWVDSADWRESDLAMMTPEQREEYEHQVLRERPKYVPMKPDQIAKLSPEDREEYENSLKITKTPRRYHLRSKPY